jgi:hypothetical protein
MALLQRAPSARKTLLVWSVFYLLFSIASTVANWAPRMELVQQNNDVKGMFLAQLVISTPLYLALPVFLLIFLNRKRIRNEIAFWR